MSVTESQALQCCASKEFARKLSQERGAEGIEDLIGVAQRIWWNEVGIAGWLEAFAAHPRIGDMDGLKKKFGGFAEMSKGEQAGAASAPEAILKALSEWNKKYEARFGHIFIICASGKSAAFMLEAVKSRYANTPHKEISTAAAEQMKITELRLRSLLGDSSAARGTAAAVVERRSGQMRAHFVSKPLTSPITSHVLDTARGRPAEGVGIVLERQPPGSNEVWEAVASAVTNEDGRVPSLLPPAPTIKAGVYRIKFDMSCYMDRCRALHPDFFAAKPFYPWAAVQFEITPQQASQHFHIPLTWNPYGYSTYRGS